MENKLNIAELLKDCPKGMELDCTMFESLEFDSIVDDSHLPIRCRILNPDGNGYNIYNFTKYGCWNTLEFAKCVIFPKGKTTWEGFQRPFKDGDVVVCEEEGDTLQIFILKSKTNENRGLCYTGYDFKRNKFFDAGRWYIERLATEEEKQKLFDAIKANGYKWNPETKTLEKLSKFKVGDWIEFKYYERKPEKVIRIENNVYWLSSGATVMFQDESAWDLTTNKFDITTLKPFDKVLVRGNVGQKWIIDFFGFMDKDKGCPFVCVGHYISQCIPYEQNKHLLNTTDDCDDYFKTWE